MLTKNERQQKRWEMYKSLCAKMAGCCYANGYQRAGDEETLELMCEDVEMMVNVFEKKFNL